MGTLEFSLKPIEDVEQSNKKDALDVLLDLSIIEHVSAVEGAPDGISEDALTFEVKITSVIQIAIELHFKMHMVVHCQHKKVHKTIR